VGGVSQNLNDVQGLPPELIEKLKTAGVATRDDLADLAVDELTEITGQSADEAKALIMTARAHWFTDDAGDAAAPAAAQEH
ncbi:MAG: NusA antitermination factor, partial [Polaromonas sp.]|nr:NusA antitermination factor [Polaromonas sp.]